MSEQEAVAAALQNNPDFRARLARLGISAADLQRARTLANPSVSAVFGGDWELTLTYPIDLIWKRPMRVKAARAEYASQVQQVMHDGLSLVADTRLAYTEAIFTARKAALAEDTIMRTARMSRMAMSRNEAGDISKLEAQAVAAEAAIAVQNGAQARLDQQLAINNLRRLTKLDRATWNGAFEPASIDVPESLNVDVLIQMSWERRPDVRAALWAVEAATAGAGLARAEALGLAAGVKLSDTGEEATAQPTADLSLPIFDRGQADVMAARARIEEATHLLAARRQQAAIEVQNAVASVEQLESTGRAWRERIIPELEDNVQSAERAYQAGDVSYLAVLDHQRLLTDAQLKQAESEAALRRAAAALARAVGGTAMTTTGAIVDD